MSICKLGKYNKYIEVHMKQKLKQNFKNIAILEDNTFYSGTKTLHFAWPGH